MLACGAVARGAVARGAVARGAVACGACGAGVDVVLVQAGSRAFLLSGRRDIFKFIQEGAVLLLPFVIMVNGLHLYSTFIQSAVQFMPLIHTHIHTPTAIGCHARYQPARREQLGVRCVAQGHFDKPRVGSNQQTSDC